MPSEDNNEESLNFDLVLESARQIKFAEDDDDVSHHSHVSDTSGIPANHDDAAASKLDQTLAKTETRAVRYLKRLILLGLAVTAIVVCVVVWVVVKRTEREAFAEEFYRLAQQLSECFIRNQRVTENKVQCWMFHRYANTNNILFFTLPSHKYSLESAASIATG